MHNGIEPLLAQLGIANRLAQITGARHTGIWIKWGGPCRCEPFGADAVGPWQGFQVWRADLDGLLMTRAQELGAEVRRPLAVTGLARGGVMAAATLDPTSSHGVLKAIMSGMMAGHLIAGVLSGRAPADEAAAAYHDWLAGWFAADAERLAAFYRALGA